MIYPAIWVVNQRHTAPRIRKDTRVKFFAATGSCFWCWEDLAEPTQVPIDYSPPIFTDFVMILTLQIQAYLNQSFYTRPVSPLRARPCQEELL